MRSKQLIETAFQTAEEPVTVLRAEAGQRLWSFMGALLGIIQWVVALFRRSADGWGG